MTLTMVSQQDVKQNYNPQGRQCDAWRPPRFSFNSAQMSVDIFPVRIIQLLKNP